MISFLFSFFSLSFLPLLFSSLLFSSDLVSFLYAFFPFSVLIAFLSFPVLLPQYHMVKKINENNNKQFKQLFFSLLFSSFSETQLYLARA